MMRAIDVALAAIDGRQGVVKMEQLFEGFNPSEYDDEARTRWGTTDAFAEAGTRTKRYSPDDWKAITAEQSAIYGDAYAALQAGKAPSDADVMEGLTPFLAEAIRANASRHQN